MHILSFRSLLLLFGFGILIHALTIPNGDRLGRRIDGDGTPQAMELDRRLPKGGGKPPKPPPSTPKPPPPPSPTPPKSNPPAPSSATPPQPNTPAPSSATPPQSNTPVPSSTIPQSSAVLPSSTKVVSSASVPSSSASSVPLTSSVQISSLAVSSVSGSVKASTTGSVSTSSGSSSVSACSGSGTKSGSCASKTLSRAKFPRQTKAVDVCMFPEVDCFKSQLFDDLKGIPDDSGLYVDSTNTTEGLTLVERGLVKRNSRLYGGIKLGGTSTMSIKSLGYPGPQELFVTGSGKTLAKHAFTYNSVAIDDYQIKDDTTVQPSGPDHGWAVEHIIELQSVKMFIEYCVSKGVPGDFFAKFWNEDVNNQLFFDSRPYKPAYTTQKGNSVSFGAGQRSLNNLVFQALGSSYNRADFVLCESGINGWKESAWALENFMDPTSLQMYARDAASGAVGSDSFLSPLRTTLTVFEYFNHATIVHNLKEASMNVRVELSNAYHFWSAQFPQTWPQFNLQLMWNTWLSDHLEAMETHASTWLDTQLKVAEKAYDTEIAALKKKLTALQAEEKKHMVNQATWDQYAQQQNVKFNKIHEEANGPAPANGQPATPGGLAKKWFDAVDAAKLQEQKIAGMKSGSDKDKEKRVLAKKEKDVYDTLKVWRLKEREKSYLSAQSTKGLLDQAEADQKIVVKFRNAQKALKMPTL